MSNQEVNFVDVVDISEKMLGVCAEETIISAAMGASLVIARLLTVDQTERDPEADGKFVTDLLDWASAYLVVTPEGKMN